MSDSYSWRGWKVGDATPSFASTSFLNDGAAFDHTTRANNGVSTDDITEILGGGGLQHESWVDFGTSVAVTAVRFSTRATRGTPVSAGVGYGIYTIDSGGNRSVSSIASGTVTNNGFQDVTVSVSATCNGIVVVLQSSTASLPAVTGLSLFDLRYSGSTPSPTPCNPPRGIWDIPRGAWTGVGVTGTVPHANVDDWVIVRCGTAYDSGLLGGYGLDGWGARAAGAATGADYDLFAPPDASILDGYQARIRRSGPTHYDSIDFNVIAGDSEMPNTERPRVFERWRFGIENAAGTPVIPNRESQMLMMGLPTPVEPGQVIFPPGGVAAVEIVSQKGHSVSPINGPLGFVDLIYAYSQMFGRPLILTPPGAVTARDLIWRPKQTQEDDYVTATVEWGQTDYPARFSYMDVVAGGLSLGKTENTFDGQAVGQRMDETVGGFSGTPTLIPLVPIVAKDNGHWISNYVGTAGLVQMGNVSELCDTQTMQLTWGTRRNPHFTQCTAQPSFSTLLAQQNSELAATLTLSHKSVSRGYLTQLRNRSTDLQYTHRNVGPLIEGSLSYEHQIDLPFKFESTERGDSDGATTGVWQMRPLFRSDLKINNIGTAGGFAELRIRAPFSALPSAQTLTPVS